MIDTGKLRHRVTFQQRAVTSDSFGGESVAWQDYYTCWASVDVLRSAMLYQTAQFISQSTYRIEIRYPRGVTIGPGDRITGTGGDVYVVDAVTNPEQRNISLVILAHILNELN